MSDEARLHELIDAFRGASTALISDNLERLPGALGLRPYHGDGMMVGTALTVKTRAGDNLAIHRALETVKPGQVIVVDGEGDVSRALIGEIMVSIAKSRGAAGFVIHGAIRDTQRIGEIGFPCFAMGCVHRGPYKNGPGQIDVPVSIGGMIVSPGDLVVGDDDGVVAFSPEAAPALLGLVRAQQRHEAEILQTIHEGRYRGAYASN